MKLLSAAIDPYDEEDLFVFVQLSEISQRETVYLLTLRDFGSGER